MEFKLGEYRIALSDQQVVKVKLTKDAAGELRWQTVEVRTQAITLSGCNAPADYETLREQAKLISAAKLHEVRQVILTQLRQVIITNFGR